MPTIAQYPNQEKLFALFLSRSKAGKSAAAASLPKPFYQMDIDGRFDGVMGAIAPPFGRGFIKIDKETDVTFDRFYTKLGFDPIQKKLDEWDMARITKQFNIASIEIASLTSLMQAMINSSHELQGGKKIGKLRMSGPGDFGFEVSAMRQFVDYLAVLPCHIIFSAHIIDKYGKPKSDKPGAEYAPNEVIGEKLCLRDQPGEVIQSFFGNVFRFDREVINDKMEYFVDFNSDVAGNTFGIPPGRFNITNKPFYPFLQDLIKQIKEGTFKPKEKKSGLSFSPIGA